MTDLAAKYENAPHSLVMKITFGSQEVPVALGTFPNPDAAMTASSAAFKEIEALIAASPLADSATVSATFYPAPADWKERVADVLTSLKEEQDEHDAWVASIRAMQG